MSRYKMISIPEALDTVLQYTPVLATETVPLQAALGHVLAAAVTSRDALPPFPASIKVWRHHHTHSQYILHQNSWCHISAAAAAPRLPMPSRTERSSLTALGCALLSLQDGYAVVSSDGPGEYAVVGESRAGYMDDMQLTAGQVAYITTGTCTAPPATRLTPTRAQGKDRCSWLLGQQGMCLSRPQWV